jgi:hypothetical protein
MTATNTVLPDAGESREVVALACVLEALTWRHLLESTLEVKRPGQRVVIHPDFLHKLGLGLSTTDLVVDPHEELWGLYQGILDQPDTWQGHCRQIILPESDYRLVQWDDTRDESAGWMGLEGKRNRLRLEETA